MAEKLNFQPVFHYYLTLQELVGMFYFEFFTSIFTIMEFIVCLLQVMFTVHLHINIVEVINFSLSFTDRSSAVSLLNL